MDAQNPPMGRPSAFDAGENELTIQPWYSESETRWKLDETRCVLRPHEALQP